MHYECTIKAEPLTESDPGVGVLEKCATAFPHLATMMPQSEDIFKVCAEHVAFNEIVVPGIGAFPVQECIIMRPTVGLTCPGVVYVEHAMEARSAMGSHPASTKRGK